MKAADPDDELYRRCPRCGRDIYRGRWEQHGRDCLTVSLRYGSLVEMAALFLAEPEMRLTDLMHELPGIGRKTLQMMLAAGGVTADVISRRAGGERAAPRQRCGRCTILLDARGVRRGTNDPALCDVCDGSAPTLRVEPDDGLPVLIPVSSSLPGRGADRTARY